MGAAQTASRGSVPEVLASGPCATFACARAGGGGSVQSRFSEVLASRAPHGLNGYVTYLRHGILLLGRLRHWVHSVSLPRQRVEAVCRRSFA